MGNINLFFFCYRTETNLLLNSVAMAHSLFGYRRNATYILYEAAQPLSYEDIKLLKETFPERTEIAPTYYNRNRNQHGQECILGMVEAMLSRTAIDEIAVKIDPDTLVMDTTYVDRMVKNNDIKFSASYRLHPHYAMGLTYAVSGFILDDLLDDIKAFPAHHEALENFEISQRIFRLFGEEAVARIPFGPNIPGGFYIGEPHDLPTKDGTAEKQLLQLGAYSCGWSYNANNLKDQTTYRQRQIDFMAKTRELKTRQLETLPATTEP